MPSIENALICSTPYIEGQDPPDALGFSKLNHWEVRNCIVDLTSWPQEKEDEAVGVTWGASATFTNCVIRGAAKNILCGCGDKDKIPLETGKRVEFNHCIIEDFCRRGPEVQDGMICVLRDCVIRNWGVGNKFDTRAFGAWAHKGGSIRAENCVFMNFGLPPFSRWFIDHWHHFWQCIKERGIRGLFHRDAYLSGYDRALTAGPDGHVEAFGCFAPGLVIDGHIGAYMTARAANDLIESLEDLKMDLAVELDWKYPEA